MFKVWYINFEYFGNGDKPFPTVEEALAYAKSKSFQASIVRTSDNQTVASWCPIAGVKFFEQLHGFHQAFSVEYSRLQSIHGDMPR